MTTVEEPTAKETVGPRLAEPGRTLWQRLGGPAGYLEVVVIQLGVIWSAATRHVFDGDEGFYAIVAKFVEVGEEPSVDLWFQNTPGLPDVYGAWTRLTGESFQNQRNLSVLLTVALGVTLYADVDQRHSRRLGIVRSDPVHHLVIGAQLVLDLQVLCGVDAAAVRGRRPGRGRRPRWNAEHSEPVHSRRLRRALRRRPAALHRRIPSVRLRRTRPRPVERRARRQYPGTGRRPRPRAAPVPVLRRARHAPYPLGHTPVPDLSQRSLPARFPRTEARTIEDVLQASSSSC